MKTTIHFDLNGFHVRAEFNEQKSGRLVVTELTVTGTPERPVNADILRALALGRLEAQQNAGRDIPRPSKPLTRPDGRDPDGFYQTVAEHYRWHAAQSPAPAARMAQEAGVPVTTAHRWIREARLRGALPLGTRGKVSA